MIILIGEFIAIMIAVEKTIILALVYSAITALLFTAFN
jgi:hypothetical protein